MTDIKMKDTFRYRNVWMGIAILLVLFFHSKLKFDNVAITTIEDLGYIGVDIFLFASGIGCYYSLQKNSDAADFIKRRMIRILPMYLCFIVVWLVYKRVFFEMPVSSMIGNLFSVQNFTGKGNEFNWYISAMWLMYLLAPLFFSVVSKINRWIAGFGILGILVLFSISYWYAYTYVITVARIPIFFLGMLVAKKAVDGFVLKKWHIALAFAMSVAGAAILVLLYLNLTNDRMWLLGLLWYPCIAIVPGMCIAISLLCSKLEKSKFGQFVVKVFSGLGTKTFSVYLVHIFVLDIFANILVEKGIFADTNLNRWLLILPIAVGCILLEVTDKFIQKWLR